MKRRDLVRHIEKIVILSILSELLIHQWVRPTAHFRKSRELTGR